MGSSRALADLYSRHRFAALLLALLLSIAGHGLVKQLLPVANPLEWLLGASLVAVVFSARPGPLRWLLGGLVLACVATRLLQPLLDPTAPPRLTQALLAVAALLAAGVSVRRAFESGPVDTEHLSAALDAYLLAGLAFGSAYWCLESLLPGSFAFAASHGFTPPRAIYFSFVVQTTLGFGDITPASEAAQGLVVAQGVMGQIYLVVLVARLVSLHAANDRRTTPS